jgi:hypothetical protein
MGRAAFPIALIARAEARRTFGDRSSTFGGAA